MNTLSRALTARVLIDPLVYPRLRQHWSALLTSPRKHQLGVEHHLLYLALIGKDWRKGFTPVTNPRKLANGGYYNWGLLHALRRARLDMPDGLLRPFDGLVTVEMLHNLRQLLPRENLARFQPEQFFGGNFPFDAYFLPVQADNESVPHA